MGGFVRGRNGISYQWRAQALNAEQLGFTLQVFETGGSAENLRLLEQRRIDVGTIQADTPASDGVLGLTTLYTDAYHLIARDDIGIDSFADLPGRRIALPG